MFFRKLRDRLAAVEALAANTRSSATAAHERIANLRTRLGNALTASITRHSKLSGAVKSEVDSLNKRIDGLVSPAFNATPAPTAEIIVAIDPASGPDRLVGAIVARLPDGNLWIVGTFEQNDGGARVSRLTHEDVPSLEDINGALIRAGIL